MKQNITIKQLNELTLEQKEKLREWWKPATTDLVCDGQYNLNKIGTDPDWNNKMDAFLPLLSIGQMIEFLLEQDSGYFSIDTLPVNSPLDFEMGLIMVTDDKKTFRKPELADALWEAVKEVLI